MRINSYCVSNPFGAIKKAREYKFHLRCPIEWDLLTTSDKDVYATIFGAGKRQLRISLIVPIVNNFISLNECRLHISPHLTNPSFDGICRVDDYVSRYKQLPDYCGLKVVLTPEEKVNLMCLIR